MVLCELLAILAMEQGEQHPGVGGDEKGLSIPTGGKKAARGKRLSDSPRDPSSVAHSCRLDRQSGVCQEEKLFTFAQS